MSTITLEQAQRVAVREMERLQRSPRLAPYDDFSPVKLLFDRELTWTFVSGSQKLQDEGWIPGALFVTVDKRDGHIWTEREFEQYAESVTAQKTQPVTRVA